MEAEDTILVKVQKLVDKAWSTTFPAEKESLLAKADALMMRYSIDQFKLLDPSRPNTHGSVVNAKPILHEMWYFGQDNDMPEDGNIRDAIHQMWYSLATHFGCRVGYFGWRSAKVVGYQADIDFLEMMFLSLKLHLITNADPMCVPEVSWEGNVIAMKQSGMKWEQIHEKLQRHPSYPLVGREWSKSVGLRMYAVHKDWRDANPDEIANTGNPAQWRRSFVTGYVAEIRDRLAQMRRATMAAEENRNLPALLADKKSEVDEAFLIFFPPPDTVPNTAASKMRVSRRYAAPKQPTIDRAAVAAGRGVAKKADLSGRAGKVGGSHGAIG